MGSKNQSTTTETSPWKPAVGALENILSQAGNLFDAQGGINAEFIEREIADLTPEMQEAVKNMVNTEKFQQMAQTGQNIVQSGVSGLGQATGMLGGLAQQGITADKINEMASSLYDSDLVKSQKEQMGKDIQSGLDKSVQGINQRAAGSGNMGSSRAGVAEGVAIGEASDAYAAGAAGIENVARQSAMQQALGTLQGNQQTALGAAGQMGQLGLGQVGMLGQTANIYNQGLQNALTGGSILQNQAQNVLNNKWFNAQGQQNMGWDMLNKYLGVAGSIGGMGGSTTQTGPGADRFGQLLGAGATLGGAFLGGPMGAAAGSSMFGGKSDRRLKENLQVVAEADLEKGIPAIYTWTWNRKALELFMEHDYQHIPPAQGVIAQELEEMGLGEFVVEVPTQVEGLGGSVKVVNYKELAKKVFGEEGV